MKSTTDESALKMKYVFYITILNYVGGLRFENTFLTNISFPHQWPIWKYPGYDWHKDESVYVMHTSINWTVTDIALSRHLNIVATCGQLRQAVDVCLYKKLEI